MSRPSIVSEILQVLEPWLEARMVDFEKQPEKCREPTLPTTNDGKINVRELTIALGLKRSQEQHFFNHAELRALINAATEAQGLSPIGSHVQGDEDDVAVRKRIARVSSYRNDLARTNPC